MPPAVPQLNSPINTPSELDSLAKELGDHLQEENPNHPVSPSRFTKAKDIAQHSTSDYSVVLLPGCNAVECGFALGEWLPAMVYVPYSKSGGA